MKIQKVKYFIRKIFLIFFILFSFILIFIAKPEKTLITKTNSFVLEIMSPFIKLISYPIYSVLSFSNNIKNFNHVNSINKNLRQEISNLKEKLNNYKTTELENTKLREIANFKSNSNYSFITTKVIGYAGSSVSNIFILDAGEKDNIKKYNPVLVDGYLVGQIISTSNNYSKLLLITDASSKIPVFIERTGTRAFLQGNNTDKPQVVYFENKEPVTTGDTIITSGMGNGIPYGLRIGVVSNITNDNEVIMKPFIHSSNITYVKILNNNLQPYKNE